MLWDLSNKIPFSGDIAQMCIAYGTSQIMKWSVQGTKEQPSHQSPNFKQQRRYIRSSTED